MQTDHNKTIHLTSELIALLELRARALGVSADEYIRHLILSDIKQFTEPLETVSEATESQIAQAQKDFSEGNFTDITPGDNKALDTLLE